MSSKFGSQNRNFSFVKKARIFFIFSLIITVLGIATLAIFGLNYGVDFRAGSSVDIALKQDLSGRKAEIEQFLQEGGFGTPVLTIGSDRITMRFDEELKDDKEKALKEGFAQKFDKHASMEINTVDAGMARELQFNALKALGIASIGIIIYVAIRFEWRFGVAAIIGIMHAAFFVISMFSILQLEVTLTFIVAVLTIVGYSINDTIVIFDRIRENMRFAKLKTTEDLIKLVDDSIWQTLRRSINTVVTVVICALSLFLFGSESIKLFSLAILFGLICGAYSSIFIASPLWVWLKSKQKKAAAKSPAAS
ncbi:protein translocase subunit SecF [Paenibacillus sp. GCM10027626]|uniref:protein translocase subunit SecF n=1 Tax=Paenibacillus sp. GCM10027626 TaxID=3273411 RepID=UPI0036274F13